LGTRAARIDPFRPAPSPPSRRAVHEREPVGVYARNTRRQRPFAVASVVTLKELGSEHRCLTVTKRACAADAARPWHGSPSDAGAATPTARTRLRRRADRCRRAPHTSSAPGRADTPTGSVATGRSSRARAAHRRAKPDAAHQVLALSRARMARQLRRPTDGCGGSLPGVRWRARASRRPLRARRPTRAARPPPPDASRQRRTVRADLPGDPRGVRRPRRGTAATSPLRQPVNTSTPTRENVLGDKQAAKLRRRDNREQREREKAARTGDSPAQKAEQTRRRKEASAERKLDDGRHEHGAD